MVESLNYHSGISLDEAKERYGEVVKEFDKVKSNYSGFFGKFKRDMREEDIKTLANLVKVLFPLGVEVSVQEEIRRVKTMDDALFGQVLGLYGQITDYLAKFKNTGVTKLRI